jgi:hypothetical protein
VNPGRKRGKVAVKANGQNFSSRRQYNAGAAFTSKINRLGRAFHGRTRMKFFCFAVLGAMILLFSDPALALTVSNVDAKPYKITVISGGASNEVTVEPEKQVEPACSGGCKVKLESGDEYQLKGEETVSLEDGALFVDHSPDADVKDIPNIDPDAPPPQ